MTLSEQEKHTIKTMREDRSSFAAIGRVLKKTGNAVKQWWHKNKLLVDLPPKLVARKRKTNGRIGLFIKKHV